MSACRCPHCSATGLCQCYECMGAARGKQYVAQHRANRVCLAAISIAAKMDGGPSPLALFFLPRAVVGASQLDTTYPCKVCQGNGYNYIGPRR